MLSNNMQAAIPPSKKRVVADEVIRRWVQDRDSRETIDPNSEEDTIPPGAQALHPGRVPEAARVLHDGSRELQDPDDSPEDNGGRPAGARGDADYDGTGLLKESLPTGSEQLNEVDFHSLLPESREVLMSVRSPAGEYRTTLTGMHRLLFQRMNPFTVQQKGDHRSQTRARRPDEHCGAVLPFRYMSFI